MQPWLWHPIFVHFTVALLVVGSLLFIIGTLTKEARWQPSCLNAARWIFWLGIGAALCTVATGLIAYYTVPHAKEETHALMNRHLMMALITATFYLALAFWLWRRKQTASTAWIATLLPAIALLGYTAYLGGELVFTHGVGIQATQGSALENHEHGSDSGHHH